MKFLLQTTLYQEELNKLKLKDLQIVELKNNLVSANTALSAAQSLNNTPRPAGNEQVAVEKQDHQASPDNTEESTNNASGNFNDGLIDFNLDQVPKKSEATTVPQNMPDLISFMDFDTPSTANVSVSPFFFFFYVANPKKKFQHSKLRLFN